MEHYPEATYQFLNEEWDNQGHATVWVSVKIGELDRLMWLPVMDYKNKAIPNPDTRAVSHAHEVSDEVSRDVWIGLYLCWRRPPYQ